MQNQHSIKKSPSNFVEMFSLNYEQAKVFTSIATHIESTIFYQTSEDVNRKRPEQLLIYIGISYYS